MQRSRRVCRFYCFAIEYSVSQDTAIRCMQGYDAAITFEVAPVFTGSNADKEGVPRKNRAVGTLQQREARLTI